MSSPVLPSDARDAFRRDGYYVAKGLLSEEAILPVLVGIDRLLCTRLPGAPPCRPGSGEGSVVETLHQRIAELARVDRAALGVVYQGIRKLLPFWSLLGSPRLTGAVETLLGTETLGVAFRGAGIRLDLPHEDRWRSQWHQEYHSQISSMRGLVAWFSLVPVQADMGPVQIARGSQVEGLLPVRCNDPMNTGRDYTQTFQIDGVDALLERYPVVSQPTGLGDVVFLDFMTLHASGFNRSAGRSRVTCQVRYFDMLEETALRHGWVGGWQDGGDFVKLHPEKVVSG